LKPRIIVLVSGGGSNLQALMDAISTQKLEAEIVLVVSNRKAAFALERATNAGIATLYFPLKPYKDANRTREEYDTDLAKELEKYRPDLLVLAGWMHIDSGALCRAFAGRIINLHPALPGQFAGAHGIEDTFAAWQRGEVSSGGCMVHEVIPELDAGVPIVVREIPFLPDDTLENYKARVHEAEHEIIVEATKKIVQDLVTLRQLGVEYNIYATARLMYHDKKSDDEVLHFLRTHNYTMPQCVGSIWKCKHISLGEAKSLVGTSKVWTQDELATFGRNLD
jgi:formyltetrahydrofolate-dependent phosphoribosylglycinamide formyltransferase